MKNLGLLFLILVLLSGRALAEDQSLATSESEKFTDLGPSVLDRKKLKSASLEFIDSLQSCSSWNNGLPCFRVYTQEHKRNGAWVELCSKAGKWEPGFYRVLEDTVKFYPPFEREFFDWSCNDDCGVDSQGKTLCYYQEMSHGNSNQLLLHYQRGLEEGEFILEMESNALKVIRHESEDIEHGNTPQLGVPEEAVLSKAPPEEKIPNSSLKQKWINTLIKIRDFLSTLLAGVKTSP